MRAGRPKRRRFRVRRKRPGSEKDYAGPDVPLDLGCCIVELVASTAVFLGLLLIPAAILLR